MVQPADRAMGDSCSIWETREGVTPSSPATLVMLDGKSKPNRTAMPDAVYRRVRDHRDQYLATRSVDVS